MNVFVARQPIFDRDLQVVAYELLFRDGPANFFPKIDGTKASTRVIHDALHVFGLDALAAGRRLYVNATREVLVQGLVRVLPPSLTTVEVLEAVPADSEVLAACRGLKQSGYGLALDDFVFQQGYEPLIEMADVIKVDFLATRGEARSEVIARHGHPRVRFLAEKVETQAEQDDAVARGYVLYQGYFFAKPEMVSAREIPAFKLNYLRLLQLATDSSYDVDRIELVIKQEVSLSVKLLRYLNCAVFGWYEKVTSIKQALIMLGERPFRRWISLLAMTALGDDKPSELVVTALVRARLCEQLAARAKLPSHALDLFLVGMLSLLDVMLGRPMNEAIAQLSLGADVRAALLEGTGPMARVLALALAYEHGDWPAVRAAADAVDIDEAVVAVAYREAVDWANKVFAA